MTVKFSWPHRPTNEREFEAFMDALDKELDTRGLGPFQRPLHVPRLLWEALNWEGDVFPPKHFADAPGYQGAVLMAKAQRWYENNYGENLKSALGSKVVPIKFMSAIWKVRIPKAYGTVQTFADRNLQNKGTHLGVRGPATFNVLTSIENFTQASANRLADGQLSEFLGFFQFAFDSLQWNAGMPSNELHQVALADYDACTSDFFGHRFGQSRWGAQQAVEKTIKGLLLLGGTPYPTDGKRGHDLPVLAQLLKDSHAVALDEPAIQSAKCTANIRYGKERSSAVDALAANLAVLTVWNNVRCSPNVAALAKKAKTP